MKKLLAGAASAALLAGGLLLASAIPASAHTGGVTGVSQCEADGTYSVTWTYSATNVPEGVEAETKAMTTSVGSLAAIDGVDKGGQIFLSVWTEHQVNVPGVPVRTGNWSAQFKTVGIPGSATEVTTMVQTDWLRGPSEDPVGKVVLDGKCAVVVPPTEEPPTEEPPTEEPPVEQPPTEEPPVTEPPAEEPPVETPPAETPPAPEPSPSETVVPVATTTPTQLAATGGPETLPWALGGAGAVLAGFGAVLLKRRQTSRQ